VLPAFTAVSLAACVTPAKAPPGYVPPAAGQTAKLVMRGTVPAGDSYGVYVFSDTDKCTGLHTVGVGNATRNPTSTTLAANQITTIEFFLLKPTREHCSIRYSFTPAAGKTYLLSGKAVEKGCFARLLDMSDVDDIKPEPGALRRNPGSAVCLPLSQSRAVSVADHESAAKSADAVLRQGAGTDDL
jgi:hypothetical protein